jgi:translation elongation factor EF-Tu-like GTPase
MLLGVLSIIAGCTDSDAAGSSRAEVDMGTAPEAKNLETEDTGHSEFAMSITDSLRIASGGVVAIGVIDQGRITAGDAACLTGDGTDRLRVLVRAVEVRGRVVDSASRADSPVALLVDDVFGEDLGGGSRLHACARPETSL